MRLVRRQAEDVASAVHALALDGHNANLARQNQRLGLEGVGVLVQSAARLARHGDGGLQACLGKELGELRRVHGGQCRRAGRLLLSLAIRSLAGHLRLQQRLFCYTNNSF